MRIHDAALRYFFCGRIVITYEHYNLSDQTNNPLEIILWTKPVTTEMRFGYEVTMYVMNK